MPIDEELTQLIREVLQYPDGSSQQEQAMERLLRLIPHLEGIDTGHEPGIDYLSAFNLALQGISIRKQNISSYHLQRFLTSFNLDIDNENSEIIRQNFVKRFNRILKNKKKDISRDLKRQPLSLDKPIDGQESETTHLSNISDKTLSGLDNLISKEEEEQIRRIGQRLWQYIEEDPEEILRNCHPRKRPNANCQQLARRFLLKEKPNKIDIARELDINPQTLYSHWNRKCLPHLREIAIKFGYQ
jgi:AcrR family transcriptional regulator